MCTVSFLPRRSGFMLAMNRDEQTSRARAVGPRRQWTGSRNALYPSEPGGGTWIGINDAGLTLALINWYAKPQRDRALCVSRGIVIPHLLAADDFAGVGVLLSDLPMALINPFRLIAVSLADRAVREWRWDGKILECRRHGWKRRHWFSSGYDEALVNRKRAGVARIAAAAKSAQTPAWLRQLHRSHQPERGAFSVCMHRQDARTVSYTEIVTTGRKAQMRYAAGSPCAKKPGAPRLLSLASELAIFRGNRKSRQ
jgi:hypothetical protein